MATAEELTTRTVHDYVEGWHDADLARLGRALRPDLVKRSLAECVGAILTKDVMLQACAEGEGTRPASRWLTIDIVDVCGDVACSAAHSAPHRDYLHLIRAGDGWKIANALWLPQ